MVFARWGVHLAHRQRRRSREKGQVIATIDPTSLELAVRSAQSDLSNAQAQLRNAQSTQQRQLQLAKRAPAPGPRWKRAEQGLKTASASVARAKPISTRPMSS